MKLDLSKYKVNKKKLFKFLAFTVLILAVAHMGYEEYHLSKKIIGETFIAWFASFIVHVIEEV